MKAQDKIAASLADQQQFLLASHFGHFFLRKLFLPLHQRKLEEWKVKMAQAQQSIFNETTRNTVVVANKTDVIDEVFAT